MESASRDPTAKEYGLPRPDSKDENARLEIQHHLWRKSYNGALFTAPIPSDIKNVLDIGCGPGFWTRDFALDHPNTSVQGLDLNPPNNSGAPNVTFHTGNAEEQGVLAALKPEGGFDLVFMRALMLGVHDWTAHFKRCFDVIKAGGYIEDLEPSLRFVSEDFVSREDSALLRWSDRLCDGARALKCTPELAKPGAQIEEMKQAGFTAPTEKIDYWPFGGSEKYQWPDQRQRDMADFGNPDLISFMKPVTERILPLAEGYSLEEARSLMDEAAKEVVGPDARRITIIVVARWAQKPESS